ncbi:Xaa-Pro dipeptidyl-peptidase [Virgibacillus siamensis]|uniref:Xaa-Pro dipeptidyl-peptidase n=1 Tax=Virgibacillus siamensis TaxID=480071 RepID=UPI00111576BC|nr:Xaa-Pro dipeptidyl-peptidase [Virgibacillus siamensis]
MFVGLAIFMMLFSTINSFEVSAESLDKQNKPSKRTSISHILSGKTQPVYSYKDAIRETVYVKSSLDADHDGKSDKIAIDIIRPKATASGLDVPVIMDASPYYERIGRGNESEIKDPNQDGKNEKFPLFYDNYFVPRGYAIVQVDMVGTNNSDGCPTTGGYEEITSVKTVIDWLNGRTSAWDSEGNNISADWTNGKVGMIGKSYDGTLANGVAATGVEGLETIVPIAAISSWYDYYRYGGIPYYKGGPAGLANAVVASDHRFECKPVREQLTLESDDQTGNYNDFWEERDYTKDAEKVSASVFVIHGINDYNVKTNHFAQWWEELKKHNVPRKLWLSRTGHVDPFDFRREEWVDTLHQWFDYWLMGINNGIMEEPMVDIQRSANEWQTQSSWPGEETNKVTVRLAPSAGNAPGTLTKGPVKGRHSQSFVDNPEQTEKQMVTNPLSVKENRLIYLSPKLEESVRISGTPKINIRAKVGAEDTNLTALIVDYGSAERVNYENNGGIRTLNTESCWGKSILLDDACYKQTKLLTATKPYEIVTRSWFDAQNWKSLYEDNPLRPGQNYWFQWEALPVDYVFERGHRIGIVLAGSDDQWTIPEKNRAEIEVALGQSSIELPIVGGDAALKLISAKNMKKIVKHLVEKDEINSNRAHALNIHLTTVERFETQEADEKVVKHMKGFNRLLKHQLQSEFISEKAYNTLKNKSNALIREWQDS